MTIQTFTSGVQASLEPWNDAAGHWQAYIQALGNMYEQAWAITAPQGSPDQPATYAAGWSTLLNVDTCPTFALPWLGMLVGVFVPPNTSDAAARSLIRAEQGFQRGQGFGGTYSSSTLGSMPPANGGSIVVAAQNWLTGTQTVTSGAAEHERNRTLSLRFDRPTRGGTQRRWSNRCCKRCEAGRDPVDAGPDRYMDDQSDGSVASHRHGVGGSVCDTIGT